MSGDHVDLSAWLDAQQAEIEREHRFGQGVIVTCCRCDPPEPCEDRAHELAAVEGLRAALDELKQLRAEREADDLCARTAAELLAAIVAPDCDTDRYGNCATHGVLVLDAGSQCPHVLARAFLSSARLWLDPAPQQPEPDRSQP